MAKSEKEIVKEVRGKVVDRVVISYEENFPEVEIRFRDNTSLGIQLEADVQLEIVRATLLGWKKGNSRVIRNLL